MFRSLGIRLSRKQGGHSTRDITEESDTPAVEIFGASKCPCIHNVQFSTCFVGGLILLLIGVSITVICGIIMAQHQSYAWPWVLLGLGAFFTLLGTCFMTKDYGSMFLVEKKPRTAREIARELGSDSDIIMPPTSPRTPSSNEDVEECQEHVVAAVIHHGPDSGPMEDQPPGVIQSPSFEMQEFPVGRSANEPTRQMTTEFPVLEKYRN